MYSPKMERTSEPLVVWRRLGNWIEARSDLFAGTLLVCFLGVSLAIAARRPFGCDEIITVSIARAPTITKLFADFRLSFDQTPPLNTILVRLFSSLFGWTELSARLPSIVFVIAGLSIIFRRVQGLTNGLFGLTAMSVLLVTFLPRYAYEARPYAMLFFASALAIWFWTSDPDDSSQQFGRRSVLFGLVMLLAVSAHYYAVLLILPFAADELRTRGLRKMFSIRLVCGCLGIGFALAIHFPFIRAASQFRQVPFGGVPSVHNLQQTYVEMMVRLILVAVCAILLFAWGGFRAGRLVEGVTEPERLGWFFMGIPVAGYILAKLLTHAFWTRYFIPMLAGFGLAFACFLYRHYRNNFQAPLLILFLTVPLFLEVSVSDFRNARTSVVSKRAEESDFVDYTLSKFREQGKRFVVLPTLRSYVEARYYAADPQMIRVLLPSTYPRWFLSQNPIGIRYFSEDDLRRHAPETAFVTPSPDLLSTLEKLGFHIRWRMTRPEAVAYAE